MRTTRAPLLTRPRTVAAAVTAVALGGLGLAVVASPGSASVPAWSPTHTLALDVAKLGATRLPTPTLASQRMPVAVGDNGQYPATPGYDEVTGLGAPDFAALNTRLQ